MARACCNVLEMCLTRADVVKESNFTTVICWAIQFPKRGPGDKLVRENSSGSADERAKY